MTETRPATLFDFYYIADHLREIDALEVSEAYGKPARDVVRESAQSLKAEVAIVDGLPAVLFGLHLGKHYAAPWLIATDAVENIPNQTIAEESLNRVQAWLENYGYLRNRVHKDNHTSIEWLRWLGFTIAFTNHASQFYEFWQGDPDAIIVRQSSVDEITSADNLPDLLEHYAQESSIDGLGSINPDWTTYKNLEQSGYYTPVAVFVGGVLAGFAGVIITQNPHYGKTIAVTESLFVDPQFRKHGVGNKLTQHVETLARDRGAAGLLISAPSGGRLEKLLPASGYRETNRAFFKGLQ
jgi:GNAT superfamily N-acetyltransferase